MRWNSGTSKSKPMSMSWRIARGVRPSPQVLLRGNSFRSTRVTSCPSRPSQWAADAPAGPPPTTSTDGDATREGYPPPRGWGESIGSADGVCAVALPPMERETLDWAGYGVAARELAAQVADSGYRPDIILAIARGGLFVAGSLGYALAVKNLYVMNLEF